MEHNSYRHIHVIFIISIDYSCMLSEQNAGITQGRNNQVFPDKL